MSRLGTEGAFEVLAKARRLEAQGKKIVHLEIGEPDFATPDNIVEAGISAMQNGYTHYTPASGIFEAREAVAGFVSRTLKTEVDPTEVVLVPGSKNVLLFTLLACIEPGDEVILPDPGYPAYASQVNFIGGVVKPVTLREETGFRMDLDELASLVTPKTRMLIVNTPQNPTGGVLTEEDVKFVCDLAHEHDLLVVSDEIYSQIVYGFHHVSPMSHPGMRHRGDVVEAVDDLAVDLVGDDQQIVFMREVAHELHILLGQDSTGRVLRSVDDQHSGLRRDQRSELVEIHAEAALLPQGHRLDHAADEIDL